jgi:hypothetical protein
MCCLVRAIAHLVERWQMSMEQWWNDDYKRKTRNSGKNLLWCHFITQDFIRVSWQTQIRIYKVGLLVVPTLLFGTETWVFIKRDESRIKSAEIKFLINAKGSIRLDRTNNTDNRRTWRVTQKVEVPSYTIYILFTIKYINRATCFCITR